MMTTRDWLLASLAVVMGMAALQAQESRGSEASDRADPHWEDANQRLGDESIDEDAYEEREDLRRHPVNINSASKEILLRIPGVTETTVDRLLAWRAAGRIQVYSELRRIPGMSEAVLQSLRRYTVISGPMPPAVVVDMRSRNTVSNADLGSSASDVTRAGRSDNRILVRLRNVADTEIECLAGLRTRKDPGTLTYGDVRSGYLQVALPGEALVLTAGTYRLRHAGGLVLESGEGLTDRWDGIRRPLNVGTRLSPFVGSSAAGALTGGALAARFDRWAFLAFVSQRLAPSSTGEATGQKTAGACREQSAGATVEWNDGGCFRLSTALVHSALHGSGRSLRTPSCSVSGTYECTDAVVSGEIAIAGGGRSAWSTAVRLMPIGSATISGRIERRPPGFLAPLSESLSAWGMSLSEEEIISLLARYEPMRSLAVQVLTSSERSGIALQASVATVRRREWAGEIIIKPSSHAGVSVQFRSVVSEFLESPAEHTRAAAGKSVAERSQHVLRISLTAQETDAIRLRTRLDRSLSGSPNARGDGIALVQEIQVGKRSAFAVLGRMTIFDVSAYDARLFGVEPDLPGASSMSVYDGRGLRWAVVGSARITGGLELSLKYVHTTAAPRTDASSGRRRCDIRSWSAGIQLDQRIEVP